MLWLLGKEFVLGQAVASLPFEWHEFFGSEAISAIPIGKCRDSD
jgi:hypothetical protein